MKKTCKIVVDRANCSNLLEEAAKATPGVQDAVVSFMTLKMKVTFEEGADEVARSTCKLCFCRFFSSVKRKKRRKKRST